MTSATMYLPDTGGRHDRALKLHRTGNSGEDSKAPRRSLCGGITSSSPTGAPLAKSNSSLGVPALFACNGRGGARNRAGRESYELTEQQVGNLIAATAHASRIGLPFTRMITIHWEAGGIEAEQMAWATGRFLDMFTKALARNGSRTAWVWVHESGDLKGSHCHLLVHVPPDLVCIAARLQRGWLRRITKRSYRKRVIRSDPIGGRIGVERSNSDLHSINLNVALGYLLKGASETAAARFGLDRLEPGGRVIGKRCGTSQNIGSKARTHEQWSMAS